MHYFVPDWLSSQLSRGFFTSKMFLRLRLKLAVVESSPGLQKPRLLGLFFDSFN